MSPSVAEKMQMGDGRLDPARILLAGRTLCREAVFFADSYGYMALHRQPQGVAVVGEGVPKAPALINKMEVRQFALGPVFMNVNVQPRSIRRVL